MKNLAGLVSRPRFLILSSACYLALPYVLFFVGWLRWYLAILDTGLVLIALLYIWPETRPLKGKAEDPPTNAGFKARHLVLVLAASTLLLALAGVGGVGYQDPDWLKHNAILKDLIEQPWPIVYAYDGASLPLVYYIAFYLPAAGIGKLGGWALGNAALWVWSWIGLVLALLWFLILVRRASSLVLAFFVLFSGLDVMGEWLVTPLVTALRPEYRSALDWEHIERWAVGWQYSSNVTQLFWVPNQALVGWICTGVLLYTLLFSSQRGAVLFIFGLTALWSPFVTIGLAPYVLIDALRANGTWLERLKRYATLPNVCGAGLLALVGLFYAAKLFPTSPPLKGEMVSGFSLSAVADAPGKLIGLVVILVFCLLEFGLYAILVYTARRDWDSRTRTVFVTALVCLSLIPLYRFGLANDFAMRASIPSLFVLAIFVARALQSQSLARPARAILIALLVVGAVTPAIEFRRHISNIVAAGTLFPTYPVYGMTQYWDWLTKDKDSIILQYVASDQSPFFQVLARDHPQED